MRQGSKGVNKHRRQDRLITVAQFVFLAFATQRSSHLHSQCSVVIMFSNLIEELALQTIDTLTLPDLVSSGLHLDWPEMIDNHTLTLVTSPLPLTS
jgi:hypothetical protein